MPTPHKYLVTPHNTQPPGRPGPLDLCTPSCNKYTLCMSFMKMKLYYIGECPGLLCGLPDSSQMVRVYATTIYPRGDTAPCTHWAVPWAGPKAGTDNLETTKISSRKEIDPQSVVTIMTELFWVRESLNDSQTHKQTNPIMNLKCVYPCIVAYV